MVYLCKGEKGERTIGAGLWLASDEMAEERIPPDTLCLLDRLPSDDSRSRIREPQ